MNASTSDLRLPNFLFIGPDKSGSTWLHATLSGHPSVYLAPEKDLYFFDKYFDRGFRWYARHFERALVSHEIVGEVCHSYLYSEDAASRIARTLPDVRVMVCLRDPVELALSEYLHERKHGLVRVDLATALRTMPGWVADLEYWRPLEPYRELLGRDRIFLALFDDLRDDPQAFIDSLTDWLGIARMTLTPAERRPRRVASEARLPRVARVVKAAAVVARDHELETLVGRVKNSAIVQRALYRPLGDRAPFVPPADRDWIRGRLADDIRACDAEYGLRLMERWGWG
ncbi:MAG TPA: sulfotransferase [Solirubrobacteraceae bacterium]|jgi:hypothetical protein